MIRCELPAHAISRPVKSMRDPQMSMTQGFGLKSAFQTLAMIRAEAAQYV